MLAYIRFADRLSAWVGKAFAWGVVVMTLGICYEVVARRLAGNPTSWAFDVTYIMYGSMFMMAGAYTLSRGGHVRADFLYRLMRPRAQAGLDLVLYFLFYFPGILALIFAGWEYASRSWMRGEVSVWSPARIPIYQFKTIIVAAGIFLLLQGVAQVLRCIVCLRTGGWVRASEDVEETEKLLIEGRTMDVLRHGGEAVDIPQAASVPADVDGQPGDGPGGGR